MRAFSLIFFHCLLEGAQAAGMTHNEFSSLLSSEADGMISSLSISEADTTWTSVSTLAWENAEKSEVSSPFIVCESSGASGYDRRQKLLELFPFDSSSILAQYPIYNKSDKTCYHLMTPASYARGVDSSSTVIQAMAPVMKIRRGTIENAGIAVSANIKDIKVSVQFGPGIDAKETGPLMLERLQLVDTSLVHAYVEEAYPYSGMELSVNDPSAIFNALTIPDDQISNHSVNFLLPEGVKVRDDCLALVGAIAAQPEVISVELGLLTSSRTVHHPFLTFTKDEKMLQICSSSGVIQGCGMQDQS